MKHGVVLFITLLLYGCQLGLEPTSNTNNETLSAGWLLTLNKILTIPGQSAGVYLQNGQVVTEKEKDQYYPNCRLEVLDPQQESQTVQPDSFSVYRVKWTEEDVLLKPLLYASTQIILASGPTADAYATILYLRSLRQTEVTRLICEHWEDPTTSPQHLTLQQIRSTLGEIFTLKPGT